MDVKIHACVGDTAVGEDIRTFQEGVHVVVGTPGRVFDMIQVINHFKYFLTYYFIFILFIF